MNGETKFTRCQKINIEVPFLNKSAAGCFNVVSSKIDVVPSDLRRAEDFLCRLAFPKPIAINVSAVSKYQCTAFYGMLNAGF